MWLQFILNMSHFYKSDASDYGGTAANFYPTRYAYL